MRTCLRVLLAVCCWAVPATGGAENWPRWRGPDGNAVSGETPLPLAWDTTKNVRWKTELPGEGYSSPIVWEDDVFVSSAFERGGRRAVHCLSRQSGAIRWTREIRDGSPERTSAMTGHAAATPVTDGSRVVAAFGNAGVVCYDRDGTQLWHRKLGEFDSELGLASSPVLYRDRVILLCDHDGDRLSSFDSFLIALDLETGGVVWRTDRPGLYRSWSTPVLVPSTGGQPELVVSAQDELRGYDPEDGKRLWHVSGMPGWIAPSPVFARGVVFATCKEGPTAAVRVGGSGDVGGSHVIWRHAQSTPYACSPVLYQDRLYTITEGGVLTCLDASSGGLEYRTRLAGKFYASPVAGDGKLYFTNEAGTTFVVRAGAEFAVLEQNDLQEFTLASPAISQGDLFIRTENHLYCIGWRLISPPPKP